jgi:putative membrane protein
MKSLARFFYLLLAVLIALIGLAFHVRNKKTIVLDYFAGAVSVELSLIVVGAMVLGALLGALAMASSVLHLKTEVRRLKRRQLIAGRELASLRAISAKDVT